MADITRLVGKTPLIRVRLFDQQYPNVEVHAKAEWFNPGGSVKDRAALSMIEDGERRGVLTSDRTIIDSTSGNTGIAYALIGAAKGYRVKLVMPGNVSAERKALVIAYGAEIVYSDAAEGSDGAIRLVRELVEKEPDRYFYPDQYSNPANPREMLGSGQWTIDGHKLRIDWEDLDSWEEWDLPIMHKGQVGVWHSAQSGGRFESIAAQKIR